MNMKSFDFKIRWLPLIASALFLCHCGMLDTVESLFVSEQDESTLGAQFDTELRTNDSAKKEYPLFVPQTHADTVFQTYVTDLAQRILDAIPAADKPGYAFKFTLINADVVNAFAVPGGYVYIYTGIIKQMKNESELAGVLGHEIAHVTLHHYRDAMVKDQGLALLVQALVDKDSSELVKFVAGSFFVLAQLKISRDNESDADETGARNASRIGDNPMGIASFFQRLPDGGWEIFSDHPSSSDRVTAVTNEVKGDAVLNAIAADSATTNYTVRFHNSTGQYGGN